MTTPIPTESCSVKLASLARHADELVGSIYHLDYRAIEADAAAVRSLLADNEVMAYIIQMDRLNLLPVRR